MDTPAFANLLFSGKCNLHCPRCIGRALEGEAYPDNLRDWPLRGLDAFLDRVGHEGIREISVTGTNTDPQLFEHEARLVEHIRTRLPDVRLSLHTNGVLSLERMAEFNLHDRATISVPSFDPRIYRRMTGGRDLPDVAAILARARIPVKISTLLDDANRGHWQSHLEACRRLGIRRVVFRYPYGETPRKPVFQECLRNAADGAEESAHEEASRDGMLAGETPVGTFMGNPVYDWHGVEVTVWSFESTTARCINLFSSGEIRDDYLLDRKAVA